MKRFHSLKMSLSIPDKYR